MASARGTQQRRRWGLPSWARLRAYMPTTHMPSPWRHECAGRLGLGRQCIHTDKLQIVGEAELRSSSCRR